jgi:hypothetical protein
MQVIGAAARQLQLKLFINSYESLPSLLRGAATLPLQVLEPLTGVGTDLSVTRPINLENGPQCAAVLLLQLRPLLRRRFAAARAAPS